MSYLKLLVKPVFNSKLGILFRNIFNFKPVGFHFPKNLNSYSCSDLFFWRIDNNFETIFRYSDIPKIYYGIENSDVLFVFYDSKGVIPFIRLPQYSFFGEYQLMFDLRANFVVKVEGKEDYYKTVEKQYRTFFLCISKEVFVGLYD